MADSQFDDLINQKLNGNGYAIHNITGERTFTSIENAEISNLIVTDDGESVYDVGFLAGYIYGDTTIKNCILDANFETNGGGLLAYSVSTNDSDTETTISGIRTRGNVDTTHDCSGSLIGTIELEDHYINIQDCSIENSRGDTSRVSPFIGEIHGVTRIGYDEDRINIENIYFDLSQEPSQPTIYIVGNYEFGGPAQETAAEAVVNNCFKDIYYNTGGIYSNALTIHFDEFGDKKINVNAKVGVDAFFDSMYNTLGIKGNEAAQSYFNLFVPAVAVIEYDGVRVSQNETVIGSDGNTTVERVLRPKRYFSYTYTIARIGGSYIIADATQDVNVVSKHTIDFTMDDRVTHRGYNYIYNEEIPAETFYLTDAKNNDNLISGVADSDIKEEFKSRIVSELLDMRKSDIIYLCG